MGGPSHSKVKSALCQAVRYLELFLFSVCVRDIYEGVINFTHFHNSPDAYSES